MLAIDLHSNINITASLRTFIRARNSILSGNEHGILIAAPMALVPLAGEEQNIRHEHAPFVAEWAVLGIGHLGLVLGEAEAGLHELVLLLHALLPLLLHPEASAALLLLLIFKKVNSQRIACLLLLKLLKDFNFSLNSTAIFGSWIFSFFLSFLFLFRSLT